MGFFDSIGNALNSVASTVENAAGDVVGGVEDAVGTVVGEPVHLIQEGLQEAYKGLTTGAEDAFDVFSGAGSFMWDALKQAPEGLLHEVEAFPGQIWGGIKGFGEDAVQGAEGLYDSLKEIF